MPYTGTAVAWPLYVAVAAAINGDTALSALLTAPDKVYNLMAPPNTPGDYITLADLSESEFWMFMRGGSEAVLTLHLWAKGADGKNAAQMWGELHRLLNRATLAIDGYGSMTGTVALVSIQGDSDGKYAHGVVRYTLTAIRA